MRSWQLQDAKSRLSELIDRAQTEGPQVITHPGVAVAVVMPYTGYKKLAVPEAAVGRLFVGLTIAEERFDNIPGPGDWSSHY